MDYVHSGASVDLDLDEDIALGVAEYIFDSHVAMLLGPFGTIRHIHSVGKEPSLDVAAEAVRLELGALGTIGAYLTLLNYAQGPKYALDFWTMHSYMNPARSVAIKFGAPYAAIAGAQYELSKTKISNVGMEPIPGVTGAYSNPMGGSFDNDFYYPGKGIIEWIFG